MYGPGTLRVKVRAGRLTRDTEWFGKMDPYCILTLNDQHQKTPTAKKAGKFPTWNSEFTFRVQRETQLNIACWDKDRFKKDDFIGSAVISLVTVLRRLKDKTWVPIFYKKRTSGQISISLKFQPLASNRIRPSFTIPGFKAALDNSDFMDDSELKHSKLRPFERAFTMRKHKKHDIKPPAPKVLLKTQKRLAFESREFIEKTSRN